MEIKLWRCIVDVQLKYLNCKSKILLKHATGMYNFYNIKKNASMNTVKVS